MIKFVQNKDIDKAKWDNLISNSFNGFIYANSAHLNMVSGNWNALILDDYKAVMPLPEKTKFGIRYAMQPMFSQQLGVIFKEKPKQKDIKDFILELQNNYKYFALNLNFYNYLSDKIKNKEMLNQVLDLNKSYETLRTSFSKNTKRNINNIDTNMLEIKTNSINTDEFIEIYQANLPDKKLDIYTELARNLVDYYLKSEFGNVYSVHDKSTNNLLACVLILSYNKRHIYLLPVSNTEGKEKKAMFLLIDNFIKNNSETDFLLDFEGSNIEGIHRFYKGFGATEQNYIHIYNKPFSIF